MYKRVISRWAWIPGKCIIIRRMIGTFIYSCDLNIYIDHYLSTDRLSVTQTPGDEKVVRGKGSM